ncbi:MAG TPA: hypothetical protein VN876_10240 [Gemmatimonadaceae bacterium]|nr:hypothetical protein [Gemmatimonadaceae bacterium]
MQSKAVLVLSTAFILASASTADAQISSVTMLSSRFSLGGTFAISQPKGEFANNVPNGYGFELTGSSKTDLVLWQLGVSFTIPRPTRQ